jgi:hypothetical protein
MDAVIVVGVALQYGMFVVVIVTLPTMTAALWKLAWGKRDGKRRESPDVEAR